MSRGVGEFGPIQESIPEWAAVVVALLTQLGDVWLLVALLATVYWFHGRGRRAVASVVGVALASLGLYSGLKHVFAWPRPDRALIDPELLPWLVQPLYEATATASGYGFPSGHAVGTTVVYFGLAGALSIGSKRRRYAVAAGLVTVVCFTRVALGVHYVVDVVAGVALGGAFLAAFWLATRYYRGDRASVAFTLGVGFAGFYLLASDLEPDAVLLGGASLGAFAGWQLVRLGEAVVATDRPSQALRPLAFHGSFAAVTLAPLVVAVEEFAPLSTHSTSGVVGLVTAVMIAVPVARHSERARRVWVALAFWARMSGIGIGRLLRPSVWRRAVEVATDYVRRLQGWVQARLAG